MASTPSFTQRDYERLLELAGSQRDLFDFSSDDDSLSSKQQSLNDELVSMVARAKSYETFRNLFLDFAYTVYSENYPLISGAVSGRIAIEGLNWRIAEDNAFAEGQGVPAFSMSLDEQDRALDDSDVEGVINFFEADSASIQSEIESLDFLDSAPGYIRNSLGVTYFDVDSLGEADRSIRAIKKVDAVRYLMGRAMEIESGLVPAELAQFKLPLDMVSVNTYGEFLSVIGQKDSSQRQADALKDLSNEQRIAWDRFRDSMKSLVSNTKARASRLMSQMSSIDVDSQSGKVKAEGLSFYLNETLSGRSSEFFSSEFNPWFSSRIKEYETNEKRSGAGSKEKLGADLADEPTFVFDGQTRSFAETRWEAGELAEYKAKLESGAAQAIQSYRDVLSSEKENLLEFYGEDAIKEKSLDIGTLAIESLESKGVFAPEPIRRKVFAEVPDSIKAMNQALEVIQERKSKPEDLDPWDDLEDEEAQLLFKKATATLKWAVSNARIQLAYSGGKDSSILLYGLLKALKENQAEGVRNFPVRVISSETLIENPEITNNLHLDHQAITEWAKANSLDIECHIATPSLLSQYQVAQVGGRKLHNMPTKGSECSQDWKISPMIELRNQWSKEVKDQPIITVTGTRTEESIHRGNSMRKREDSDEKITVSDRNELIMSPIASMTTNHVFKLLDVHLVGEIADLKQQGVPKKDWPYPTDGTRTQRIYSDSSSSSCEIVNTQVAATRSAACGARTGCWNCQKVLNDTSAENMLQNAPESYAYMAPLLRYRKWVSDMHDDPASRSFVGRTITDDGMIKFGHDNYHPRFLQDMLRYLLTMQIEHDKIIEIQKQANPNRDYPKLMIFNAAQLIAVQYEWSRYGREANHPFEAFRIYDEIYNQGKRFYPPVLGAMDTARFAALPSPPSNGFIRVGKPFVDYNPENMGFISVGESALVGFSQANHGLQDVLLEMASFDGSSVHKTVRDEVTGSYTRLLDGLDEAARFDVDLEAAEDFVAFELPRLVAQANSNPPPICSGFAAKVLLQSGVVVPRSIKAQHELISQYQYLESRNLTPATYDHQRCLDLLVDKNGRPVKDKAPFTMEHYYLPDDKASKKIAEQQELLSKGRSKNDLGQSNAIFMPKDEFKKYKRLEVQMASNRVLSQVNSVLADHFVSQEKNSKMLYTQAAELGSRVSESLSDIRSKQSKIAHTRNHIDPSEHLQARAEKEKSMDVLTGLIGDSKTLLTASKDTSFESSCKETMVKIASICLRSSEIENDIAGIEVQRRMIEQSALNSNIGQQAKESVVQFMAMR